MQPDSTQESGVVQRLEHCDPQNWPVAPDWRALVDDFFAGSQGASLLRYLRGRLGGGATIYPPLPLRALELTPLASVRMVIVGQDPYHGAGQAEGLAFSVAPGVPIPPSLRNIFRELGRSNDSRAPPDGSLVDWARAGVLLLNTCLTVEAGRPASHARQGWEALTDALLSEVAARTSPCVYLLWGAHAQAKAALIERIAANHGNQVLVLRSNHPSPLSATRPPLPFLGSGHFAQSRAWLAARGRTLAL